MQKRFHSMQKFIKKKCIYIKKNEKHNEILKKAAKP